jgi:hypothetical protein
LVDSITGARKSPAIPMGTFLSVSSAGSLAGTRRKNAIRSLLSKENNKRLRVKIIGTSYKNTNSISREEYLEPRKGKAGLDGVGPARLTALIHELRG